MLSVAQAIQRYRRTADDALYLESVLQWILDHGESEPRGFATVAPALVSKIGDLDESDRRLGVRNATALRARGSSICRGCSTSPGAGTAQ